MENPVNEIKTSQFNGPMIACGLIDSSALYVSGGVWPNNISFLMYICVFKKRIPMKCEEREKNRDEISVSICDKPNCTNTHKHVPLKRHKRAAEYKRTKLKDL